MMARKIGEVDLDLHKVVVEGWERPSSLLNILILDKARDLGHILPRVDIIEENGVYKLVFDFEGEEKSDDYGGHSRTILALRRDERLRCNLYDSHRSDPSSSLLEIVYRPINESDVTLNTHWRTMPRLKRNLDFLPEDVRRDFLKENGLVIVDGELMTKYNYENPPPF